LLIVHTTIGQEVSEQNATESSLEEQQTQQTAAYRKHTGCDCATLKAVFHFSLNCALKIRAAVSIFLITHSNAVLLTFPD
jgi:hypothetical protein